MVRGSPFGASSSFSIMRSAIAFPVSLSKNLYTFLKPGFVIFSTFSDIFILGIILPYFPSIAASLYTPPNTGSDLAVMSLSPTPNESITAPSRITSRIRYSSSELEMTILQSSRPFSSRIWRVFLVKYVISPLSILTPMLVGFNSLKTRIALGSPELSTLYVSISSVAFSG